MNLANIRTANILKIRHKPVAAMLVRKPKVQGSNVLSLDNFSPNFGGSNLGSINLTEQNSYNFSTVVTVIRDVVLPGEFSSTYTDYALASVSSLNTIDDRDGI